MDTIEKLELTRNYFVRTIGADNPSVDSINEAIKALEDKEKYEKALVEMTKYFRCHNLSGFYVSEEECHKYKSCSECLVKYFKKQVGLEVSE